MLTSPQRLTTSLFKEVMDKGKLFHSPLFTFKAMKIPGTTRLSVAVSKKVAKTAVERNKIRRRTYSALRTLYPTLQSGIHGVFMAKSTATTASLDELTSSLHEFFVKIGILK